MGFESVLAKNRILSRISRHWSAVRAARWAAADQRHPWPHAFRQPRIDNAPTSFIQSYTLSQDIEHFKDGAGALNLADAFTNLTINTKTQYTLAMSSGYQYLLLSNGYGSMIDQNGAALSHGSATSTPSSISYNIGRFGPGFLRTTTRLTTLRVTPRGTLALEADNTNDTTDEIP